MLQDVVNGFRHPCVVDVKIGTQTWDPTASAQKIENEKVRKTFKFLETYCISNLF
jgi:hypothetical protein